MPTRYQIIKEGGVWDFQTSTRVRVSDTAAWNEYQVWLTNGGQPLPADNIGQQTLEVAITEKCSEIDSYASALRNKIIAGRSSGELAGWTLKLMDAIAVTTGQPSPWLILMPHIKTSLNLEVTPNSVCHAMAMLRGITEAEYAAKILRDAGQSLLAEIVIDPIRGKHCDNIKAKTNVEDIIVYKWLEGWPNV